MDWIRLVRERLADAAGRLPPDTVVEELAEHLQERYEEDVARGRDPETARREALSELEDVQTIAPALRSRPGAASPNTPTPPAMESPHMWSDLCGDLRYATRLLLQHRGFAAAALLTIALGVGAATAIFSVVDAVLLRPLPYPDARRLVAVWETDRNSGTLREPASLPDMLDMRRQSRRLDAVGGVIPDELNFTPRGGEPRRLASLLITSELLPLLGARPVLGRLFTDDEQRAGRDDVVLISERLWEQVFGRDARVIGRPLPLDDRARTVVGVLPDAADVGVLQWLLAADYGRGFADRDLRSRIDVWLPTPMDPETLPRSTHPVLVLGRLGAGVSLAEAQQELAALMTRLEHEFPSNVARGARLQPFTDVVLGRVRAGLWILLAGVCLVLVIACVNVANLLLVRGTVRMREVAVRTAIGAAPGRLARQFMVENTAPRRRRRRAGDCGRDHPRPCARGTRTCRRPAPDDDRRRWSRARDLARGDRGCVARLRLRADPAGPAAGGEPCTVVRRRAHRNGSGEPPAPAIGAGDRRDRPRSGAHRRCRVDDPDRAPAAGRRPRLRRGRCAQGGVPVAGKPLPARLQAVAQLHRDAPLQRGASRPGAPNPGRRGRCAGGQPSAGWRLHELLLRRRTRERGADLA